MATYNGVIGAKTSTFFHRRYLNEAIFCLDNRRFPCTVTSWVAVNASYGTWTSTVLVNETHPIPFSRAELSVRCARC
jgi:hypothetical protein